MSKILFISEAYLKQFSNVHDNVDPKYIKEGIRKAMDKYIQPALGTNLYNTIENNIEVSSGNMSPNLYKTLVDTLIMPAMKEWAIYEMRYELHFKITNKGVVTQQSENSTSAELAAIDRIFDKRKNDAEWYTQRLIDYLCVNASSFPEYNNNTDPQIQSQKNAYSSGWYLGEWNNNKGTDCCEDMS